MHRGLRVGRLAGELQRQPPRLPDANQGIVAASFAQSLDQRIRVAVLVGKAGFGAALFVLYWLGRALAVWLAPLLLPDASATPRLLEGIAEQRRLFHGIHVVGLVWAIAVLVSWLLQGTPI